MTGDSFPSGLKLIDRRSFKPRLELLEQEILCLVPATSPPIFLREGKMSKPQARFVPTTSTLTPRPSPTVLVHSATAADMLLDVVFYTPYNNYNTVPPIMTNSRSLIVT